LRELLGALFVYFISPVLWLLLIILIVYVVLSWLMAFGIVQRHNPTTRGILGFTESILEPLLRPIRRMLPRTGGFDFSVLILALIIVFLRDYAIPRLISLVPF